MNITNAESFSLDTNSSIFLTGQTGSGKSVLVDKLIERLVKANSPQDLRFVLLDMTGLDFWDLRKDNHNYVDAYLGAGYSDESFYVLEHMAEMSVARIEKGGDFPLHFVMIEECDMAAMDQKRFDKAVSTINKNAKNANMKLLFSTSRPSTDVISKELLASFDLILAGQLASSIDAKNLGIPYAEKLEPYSFLISRHDDLYDANGNKYEMMDISKIDTSFGGDNEPHDEYLSVLLGKAYKGELDCRKAVVKLDLIKPYSDFTPNITDDYSKRFLDRYKDMTPSDLLVYEKDGVFIMSDDYNAYFMYKEIEAVNAICTVIGDTTISEGVKYGKPFKMQMPTLEMSD